MNLRIGQGFDAHRFCDGGRLTLGGVEIPHARGLEAHSDGDCLLHAVTDAILGAIAAGDLGGQFPDSDPAFAGIDSRRLLRDAWSNADRRGWGVINVDATIIAQSPKLAPYIEAMRRNLASDVNVALEAINVKATTTEWMGFTGRGEGIAALAVVLLGT